MRFILLLLLTNMLFTSTVNAEMVTIRDTTDLASVVSPEDPDFIEVVSQELLTAYLHSETEITCPALVLVTYDETGNKLDATSYPLTQFTQVLQKDNPFKPGRIYLILTRFRTYYFSTIGGDR
ncbi:hypothetical protein LVD17_17750 [Fulvivirga ulvae]|uniref:hypothetical protein n=1 Tax=Fulvivirga ulvae TaxID=2904245 RepID=UPI001F47BC05|nr:hypothetical protein [Fulvivirga ulvae]UII30142.1 hypothetical protein LVD17_17750 [Fulvivirga ulvae]